MRIAATTARWLLGLIFVVIGLNGFFHFMPGMPPPGPATTFFTAMVLESHFYILVFGAQLIVGLLLLSNQYVPLAIVVLGAVLANVLTFHITMAPESIAPAIVAALLWVFVAWSIREEFTTLLERTPARAQMVSDQTEPERSMSR